MITIDNNYLKNVVKTLNEAYVPSMKNKKRFNLYYGGAGSGKSRFVVKLILILALTYDLNILCVRKTYNSHNNSTFKAIRWAIDDLGLTDIYKEKRSPLHYKSMANKRPYIDFIGVDDPEKLKSIEGYDLIWVEEATEIDYEDFKQLNLRLRGKGKRKQFIVSFNPIDANHWLKREFFDRTRKDVDILKTTYKDNRYLDDAYIAELESEIDDYWKEVYTKGNWGVLADLIFDQNKIKIENISLKWKDYDQILAGVDWGFSHAMSFSIVGLKQDKGNNIYVLNEIYAKGLTTNEFINQIKAKFPEWRKLTIYGDCAEPDRIEEFKQAGFMIYPVDKAQGSLKYGIDYLRRKFWIVHPDCSNLQRELKSYKYRKVQGVVTSEPVRVNDDAIDSVRYALREYSKKEMVNKRINTQKFNGSLRAFSDRMADNLIL